MEHLRTLFMIFNYECGLLQVNFSLNHHHFDPATEIKSAKSGIKFALLFSAAFYILFLSFSLFKINMFNQY